MKHTLMIVALVAVFASALFAEVKGLSVNSSVGFESEYLFRGKRLAHQSLQVNVDSSYKLYKGTLYVNAFDNAPTVKSSEANELDLSVGYKLPVYEKFTADVGVTYYWYSESDSRSREVYAGVTYSGLYVNPALYVAYDVDQEQWVTELSGAYSWDLAKYGAANTSLDVGAYVGYLSADKVNQTTANNSYTFYGVTADVVYHLSKAASVSTGIRYAANNDEVNGDEESVTWGFKFASGF